MGNVTGNGCVGIGVPEGEDKEEEVPEGEGTDGEEAPEGGVEEGVVDDVSTLLMIGGGFLNSRTNKIKRSRFAIASRYPGAVYLSNEKPQR